MFTRMAASQRCLISKGDEMSEEPARLDKTSNRVHEVSNNRRADLYDLLRIGAGRRGYEDSEASSPEAKAAAWRKRRDATLSKSLVVR